MNIKIKVIVFSHNKLKIQPRTKKLKTCLCLLLTVLFMCVINCSVLFNVNCFDLSQLVFNCSV